MHGGDGGLQCVTANRTFLKRARQQRDAFLNGRLVPKRTVLFIEWDELARGAGARGAAGIGEEHKREQAGDFGVIREQSVGGAGKADSLCREVEALQLRAGARGVALVEDEIEDMEHRAESLGALLGGWRMKANAGRFDDALRARDALRHGGFRNEKCAGDLCRRETADGTQCERNGRCRRERGMTAHEEQDESVILCVAVEIERWNDEERSLRGGGGFAIETGALATHTIGHAAGGNVDEPGARIVRRAFVRPLIRGCDQRVLHRVFRGGEVAEAMKQDAEHLRREVAQEMLGLNVQRIRAHNDDLLGRWAGAHHLTNFDGDNERLSVGAGCG